MPYYVGITPHHIPEDTVHLLELIAITLRRDGWTLVTLETEPNLDKPFGLQAILKGAGIASCVAPKEDLLSRVSFLMTWTSSAQVGVGSTAEAIRLARQQKVPVRNLALHDVEEAARAYVFNNA